jgi:rubrerythrin
MTNQEARGILANLEADYRDLDPLVLTDDSIQLVNKRIEALGIAISALEKQIPKQLIADGDGYADGEMVYDSFYCPSCDHCMEEDEVEDYCPNCGQKICWEYE